MRNRVPTKPGRVKLTPENGGAAYYATIERADEPVEAGTPISKETLLTDETAELLSLGQSDPTVDAALFKLGISAVDGYPVSITVTDFRGVPVSGVTVNGVTDALGGAAITDSSGKTMGISMTAQATLSVTSPWVDLSGVSKQATLSKTALTRVAMVMGKISPASKTVSSTMDIKFSAAVSAVDATLVGGGGGGGGGGSGGGGGGGGGYVTTRTGILVTAGTTYRIQIGAGGTKGIPYRTDDDGMVTQTGTDGSAGGTTSALGLTAAGGGGGARGSATSGTYTAPGGTGDGNGGVGCAGYGDVGTAGGDGSGGYGGGGGGGSTRNGQAAGGAPYGGNGGTMYPQPPKPAATGTGPGGGGGGGSGGVVGANGAAGAAVITWRYKS